MPLLLLLSRIAVDLTPISLQIAIITRRTLHCKLSCFKMLLLPHQEDVTACQSDRLMPNVSNFAFFRQKNTVA